LQDATVPVVQYIDTAVFCTAVFCCYAVGLWQVQLLAWVWSLW
jgi:hypothetical protein